MLNKLQKYVYTNENFLKNVSFNSDETDDISREIQNIRRIVLRYEEEIRSLKREIEQLKDENRDLNKADNVSNILKKINNSIDDLSYEPVDRDDFESILNQLDYLDIKLEKMEKNYEGKINEVTDRFEFFGRKKIQGLEKKITLLESTEAIKPQITLQLLEKDLKKIEKIMNRREAKLWNFYSMTSFVVVGVFGMVGLLMYEPFWNSYKQLLDFLGLM